MIVTVRADPMIEFFASLPSPNLTVNVLPEGNSSVIEGGGRTLKIRGQTGKPARLLDMMARHERRGRFGDVPSLSGAKSED